MLRIEDKYILEPRRMDYLEDRIRTLISRDINSLEGGYKISSLYFDDIYNSCYEDVVSGSSYKDKYRIRIYNDSLSSIKLEVKKKRYNRTKKVSTNITKDELKALMDGQIIDDDGDLKDARTLFNMAILMRGIRPRIIITYDRNAYTYESGNVRITFDRDVRYSDNTDLFGENIEYDYPDVYNNVIEIKYDDLIPKFVVSALESGNMLQSSNSKYAICAKGLFGRKI